MNRLGKVGRRRAKGMATWKRTHPCPAVCPQCGRAPDWRGMAVHHKKKRSHMGDESDDNLTWLCGICHDATEGIKDV